MKQIELTPYSWNTAKKVLFAVTLSFVVLAPIFVAAGNYLLIGRLVQRVLPARHQRVFGVHGRLITRVFVGLDIISFFVQSSGSIVAIVVNWQGPRAQTGLNVLVAGLALQVAGFCFFLAVFARFHWLATSHAAPHAPAGWKQVVAAVYISSFLILVRTRRAVSAVSLLSLSYPATSSITS